MFARARADGSLVDESGRVEIRYKLGDARAYRAALGNLTVGSPPTLHADADFPEAAAAAAPESAGPRASAAPAKVGKKVVAPLRGPAMVGEWSAFTDGACSGNPGPCGSGVVMIAPDGKMAEGYDYLGTGTNNVAELTGILRALEACPEDAPGIAVHTDSQYAIGVLTKGWKAKANQALILKIKEVLARVSRTTKVRMVYVPGHAGIAMNERADELAREAIRTTKTRPVVLATEP